MKKDDIRTMMVILSVCLVCAVIVLIFYIQNRNASKYELKEVDNSNMYFMVANYVNYYVNNLSMKNNEVVYDILDKRYIEKKKISADNLFDEIKLYPQNSFAKFREIYYLKFDNNYIFYIEGVIVYQSNIDESSVVDTDFSIIVTVSNDDKAFSIYPTTKSDYKKALRSIKKISINKNDNNGLISSGLVNKEKMCVLYMTDYIDNVYYSNDNGYNLLSTRMKEKYTTLEIYNNFILSNVEKFSTLAEKCSVGKKEGNNKIYTVIDSNGNKFVFTENAIMDYVVDFELNSDN